MKFLQKPLTAQTENPITLPRREPPEWAACVRENKNNERENPQA